MVKSKFSPIRRGTCLFLVFLNCTKPTMKYDFHLCVVDVLLENSFFMQKLLHLKRKTLFLPFIKLMKRD